VSTRRAKRGDGRGGAAELKIREGGEGEREGGRPFVFHGMLAEGKKPQIFSPLKRKRLEGRLDFQARDLGRGKKRKREKEKRKQRKEALSPSLPVSLRRESSGVHTGSSFSAMGGGVRRREKPNPQKGKKRRGGKSTTPTLKFRGVIPPAPSHVSTVEEGKEEGDPGDLADLRGKRKKKGES